MPREVAEHSLTHQADLQGCEQRLCRFDEEKRRAIGEEIAKLLGAGFIKEDYHPRVVGVPCSCAKEERGSGGCVLTTQVSTRRAPKDPFPLPRIDQMVDSTSRCEALSILDAYSGYH